jgi:eukaryotic-like serine/threonine-protein kinase
MPKILIIEDQAPYGQLLRHHITAEWADAAITEHNPATRGRLAAELTGAAYEVVVLDNDVEGGKGLEWLTDLTQRPGFPPIVYLTPAGTDEFVLPALRAGAEACVSRAKIDHRRLIGALSEAVRKRKRQLTLWRGTSHAQQTYRFGQVTIRGQRHVRTIATGPLASVYVAESERVGELVALKVLREVPDNSAAASDAAGTIDRFLQEYEVVAKIRHPNVVRIHDLGIADDHIYIAMEHFAAGDLRQRMKQPIEQQLAVDYLRQMAAALEAIHTVGVLHRDLKPGNVMLRADGSIALIDFGLAKQLKLDMDITGTGQIFGTPYYMSPEQGHGSDTDERSDLYSLGVIFHEMLTGKKPYLARTPMGVIYKHSHAPLPILPAPMVRQQPVLHKLLAKLPQNRFQSATALIKAIDAVNAPLRAASGAV